MHVVLGGGGSAKDEAAAIAHFASCVGGSRRVLYIPWASPDPAEAELTAWAEATLAAHGISDVASATAVEGWSGERIIDFDGLFIGGGNTYLLLSRLIETGVAPVIRRAVRAGVPCYGGSAGAIILGAHIGSCAHMDSNDVGLTALDGLDLCDGLVVWPHYTPQDDGLIQRLVQTVGRPVISLSEDSGACYGSHGMIAFGPGDVARWIDGRKEPVPQAA